MKNSFLFRMCVIHVCCTVMNVCFVLFLFCLHKSVCVWLQVQGLLREGPKYVRSNYKVVPVSNVFPSYMSRIYGFVLCSFSRLSVYLRLRMSANPRSIAGELSCSIQPCACRLPYHYAPLVFFPDVIGLLTVWWNYKIKTRINSPTILRVIRRQTLCFSVS